jgi:hypothetical protein
MNVAENTSDTHSENGTDILLFGIFEINLAQTVEKI